MEFNTFDKIAFSVMSKYAKMEKKEITLLSGKGVDRKDAIVKFIVDCTCSEDTKLRREFYPELRDLAEFYPTMISKSQILQILSAAVAPVVVDDLADLKYKKNVGFELALIDIFGSLVHLYKGDTEFMTSVLSAYISESKWDISVESLTELIELGADPTAEEGGIFVAMCKYCSVFPLAHVLSTFKEKTDINCRGNSPLLMASKFNSPGVIEFLVSQGAVPGVKKGIIIKTLEKRLDSGIDEDIYKGDDIPWLRNYLRSLKEKI